MWQTGPARRQSTTPPKPRADEPEVAAAITNTSWAVTAWRLPYRTVLEAYEAHLSAGLVHGEAWFGTAVP
jgi:hypothetical protein